MQAAPRETLRPGPWYREPWPWILMAGPAAAVVGGILTMVLAFRTEDGLVAKDYYRQGLAINRELRREQRAGELGVEAFMTFAGTRVRVELRGPAPPALRLFLIHPVRAGLDQTILLHRVAAAAYEGGIAPARGESRRLVLEDAASTWRLAGEWSGRDRTMSLTAGP